MTPPEPAAGRSMIHASAPPLELNAIGTPKPSATCKFAFCPDMRPHSPHRSGFVTLTQCQGLACVERRRLSWDQKFFKPIAVPGKRKPLVTLLDAARYMTSLPKAERSADYWWP